MNNTKIPIWIDIDTSYHSALALSLALKFENIDIVSVSTISAKTSYENSFNNARNILSLVKREDIKVYKACTKPISDDVKINNNLDIDLSKIINIENKSAIESELGYDALYKKAIEYNKELKIVCLGPLTNIATAIIKYPNLKDLISEIIVVGGSIYKGDISACSEFNIYSDPHSAEIVFKSSIPIRMFSLDTSLDIYLTKKELENITNRENYFSKLLSNYIKLNKDKYKNEESVLTIKELSAFLYLNYPSLYDFQEVGVYVETSGSICKGKTVCDIYSDTKFEDRHVKIAVKVDREKFVDIITNLSLE